ncbi:MAG: hypothetical protein Q8J85_07230 [Sulfuricurvum sp.]|nr:hypothetical protein [Sulfuricurvum sp.]MDP3022981.1 hypothetical protein [Sulfuricurvum sp.]
MNREEKIQYIMNDLSVDEKVAKRVFDISEEINSEDYSYCKIVLEISEELEIMVEKYPYIS